MQSDDDDYFRQSTTQVLMNPYGEMDLDEVLLNDQRDDIISNYSTP